MNILDNEETKAVSFNQLVKGEKYFKVCCGSVYPITYVRDLGGLKFNYTYTSNVISGEFSSYYSDAGVWDAPYAGYKNDLNRLFLTEEDAKKYIESEQYQKALHEHISFMENLDYELDMYEDDDVF